MVDVPGLKPWHNQMRFESLERIKSSNADNVYTYHLQQSVSPYSDIYVHAKLMIVDDCYVIIGSANLNNRSFTNDSELAVAIVDADTIPSTMNGSTETICAFAKNLRLKLWQEHLGVNNTNDIEDPIIALNSVWPNCSGSSPTSPTRKHHVVCHDVPMPRSNTTTSPIDVRTDLMNPKLDCP
jgi:phosphatidylserine/phosphatidylglycerophosphate/cardiolipin synthase-like enzyme